MEMTQDKAFNGEAGLGNSDGGSPLALRRSSRVRKRPSNHLEDADSESKPPATPHPAASAQRNPKRKAAPDVFDVPNDPLEASLGPWKENEQAEWASWIELESDPDFFTAILGLLGVKGARIEELLSVDEDSLATLPSPVYGLVFLDEFAVEPKLEPTKSSRDVWFANQTTDNACATIALLNIVMNAEGIALGEKLRKFKQDSMDLSPPSRGNMITNSIWIRLAHNSFARRLDHLDAALGLQNEVDSWKMQVKSSGSNRKKKAKRKSAKEDKVGGSSAYHFIGFVPVGQRVWQLDGLTSAPVCIGEFKKGRRWTSVMCPVLQNRMARYEEKRLGFSLLALCGDSLADFRQTLATNVRCLEHLVAKFGTNPEWHPKTGQDVISGSTDARLSAYQLGAEDVKSVSDDKLAGLQESSGPVSEAVDWGMNLWEKLSDEQKGIRAKYECELEMGDHEPPGMIGRTKDYTAAIHEWVKKVAERNALKKLHDEVHSS